MWVHVERGGQPWGLKGAKGSACGVRSGVVGEREPADGQRLRAAGAEMGRDPVMVTPKNALLSVFRLVEGG